MARAIMPSAARLRIDGPCGVASSMTTKLLPLPDGPPEPWVPAWVGIVTSAGPAPASVISTVVGWAVDVCEPPVGGPLSWDMLVSAFASSSGSPWGVCAFVYGVKP